MSDQISEALFSNIQRVVTLAEANLRYAKSLKFRDVIFNTRALIVCRVMSTNLLEQDEPLLLKIYTNENSDEDLRFDDYLKDVGCVNLPSVCRVLQTNPFFGYSVVEDFNSSWKPIKYSESEVWKMLLDVVKGLIVVHTKRAHRFVQPRNILRRESHGSAEYVLSDPILGELTQDPAWNYVAPETFDQQSDPRMADIYHLGLSALSLLHKNTKLIRQRAPSDELIKSLISKTNCSNHMKGMLHTLLHHDPNQRLPATELLPQIEHLTRVAEVLQISSRLQAYIRAVKQVRQHREAAAAFKSNPEKWNGLLERMDCFQLQLQKYVEASLKFNRAPRSQNQDLAEDIREIVDQIKQACQTLSVTLQQYVTSTEAPKDELEKLQKTLQTRIDPKKAISAGGGAGAVLGLGILAGLVKIPGLGIFLLAGASLTPVLVVGGAAITVTGLMGLGLAALIKEAVNREDKRLLKHVGQLIEAINNIKDLINGELLAILDNVFHTFDEGYSLPSGVGINARCISSISNYRRQFNEKASKLKQISLVDEPPKIRAALAKAESF